MDGPRPCPFVSCRYHLAVDIVTQMGRPSIWVNGANREIYPARFADSRFDEFADMAAERVLAMGETCTLDIADEGGKTLEEVGALYSITRERVRQMEKKAIVRLRRHPKEFDRADGE